MSDPTYPVFPESGPYHRFAYKNLLSPLSVVEICFVDWQPSGTLGDESNSLGTLVLDDIFVEGQVNQLAGVSTYVINYDFFSASDISYNSDFLVLRSGLDYYYVPLDPGVFDLLQYSVEREFAGDVVLTDTELLTYSDIGFGLPQGGGTANGSAAADSIRGSREADTIMAAEGNDSVGARAGDDVVDGEAGDDVLRGQVGRDVLDGGADDDRIEGGAGRDIIMDGTGMDILFGGAGRDVFVMTQDGVSDRIMDFELGLDRINLSAFGVSFNQLEIRDTAAGFVAVEVGGEVLAIADGVGGLQAADLSADDFVFV